jgi:hypothetical protein
MSPLTRLRRHHAIEHATIAVLFQRRGRQVSVLGRSDLSGFHLYGSFQPEEVAAALDEAMDRLRTGEHHLAITNHCGTNILATGFLTATAALLASGRNRRDGWSRAVSAATFATLLAAPVGRILQQRITTDPRLGTLRLERIGEYPMRGRRRHYRVFLTSS